MSTITMTQAVEAYRAGNNAGLGFAPYAELPGSDTIEIAIAMFKADGWELVLDRNTTDDVAVLGNADGDLIGIGGDARGQNAWAVSLWVVNAL